MLTEREKTAIFVCWMHSTETCPDDRKFSDALEFMFREGLINQDGVTPFMEKHAEYIADDERRTKELKKLLGQDQ
jgi:hypothetical protein